jgi:hypothetical protein
VQQPLHQLFNSKGVRAQVDGRAVLKEEKISVRLELELGKISTRNTMVTS